MRKLPETLSKFIREFEEEDRRLVSWCLVGGAEAMLAPDDDAFEPHAAETEERVAVLAADGELGAEAEAPAGDKFKPSLIEGEVRVGRLLVETTIEDQMGPGRSRGGDAVAHGAGRFEGR